MATSLQPTQVVTMWPELDLAPELIRELEQWERDMATPYAMSPSVLKASFADGSNNKLYYDQQNFSLGGFVGDVQHSQLETLRARGACLSDVTLRSVGIGQGHDLRGLIIAYQKYGVKIAAYDWCVTSLCNGERELLNLLLEYGINVMSPEYVLERSEIGQLVGLEAEEDGWPCRSGRLIREEAEGISVWSISRVLQHLSPLRVVAVLRGLGRLMKLNPLSKIIIVHPYPQDALNNPIETKYRTAYPYTKDMFLRFLSEGAGQECAEIERYQHEFMEWQCYTASVFGIQ